MPTEPKALRDQEKEWTTVEEDAREAARIREKRESGETLTREEAGKLGAVASARSTRQARREAEQEGRGEAFRREHQVESWTNAPESARSPVLDEDTQRRAERLRGKQQRGETLTREEAGFLGGVARAEGRD